MKRCTFFVIIAAFAALTVPALLTGCEFIEDLLGEEPPAPSPIAFASGDNSVIDQIQAAKGKASVTITLGTGEEPVQFGQGDIPSTGLALDKTNSPASVTIDGKGYTLDLTGSPADSPLITVGKDVTLTLKNITLKGLKNGGTGDSGDNTRALIRVDTGGHLVLEAGAVISDNTGTGTGNVDSNNWGGGVRVDGGTFTMKGGEVRGNKAEQAAGVYIINGGKFEMSGGTISGNEAVGGGGGVRVANGTFTMTAGAISGNKGDYSGGGVEVEKDGTFTMTGGKISGNMSLDTLGYGSGMGGGLVVSGGKAIMQGNAVIENNTADYGGGGGVVIRLNGTFTMRGNAVIRNNTADGGTDSGGVGVWSNSTFTMEGGTISGNSVTNGVGGGVYVNKDSGQFSKTGGIIYGNDAEMSLKNTASVDGHAVAVGGSPSPTKKRNNTADVDLHWPLKGDGTDNHWDAP